LEVTELALDRIQWQALLEVTELPLDRIQWQALLEVTELALDRIQWQALLEVTELPLDRIQWQALFNGSYNLQVRYRKNRSISCTLAYYSTSHPLISYVDNRISKQANYYGSCVFHLLTTHEWR
jgi:hypothetical protein